MRRNKFLRMPTIATIVCLLVIAISTAPTLASESLRVSPTKGQIGDEIDVIGSRYDPGDRVYVYFSSRKAGEGDDIDDLGVWEEVRRTTTGESGTAREGDIDTSFKVPSELNDGDEIEAVRAGGYFIYTTETKEGKIRAIDEFTVTGITLIYPAQSTVGTEVMVKGVGFSGNDPIAVFYDGDEIEIAGGDNKTDTKGNFVFTILIPSSSTGAHAITIEIDKDEDEAMFIVEPGIQISATSGMVGERVTVTGTGFSENVEVSIAFGGKEVQIAATNENGSFAINFDVPSVGPGAYDVEAKDDDGNSAKEEFTLTTGLNISPVTTEASPGHVGMEVSIIGTGFMPNSKITIVYTTSPVVVAITETKADGSFSATFKIPKSEAGEHTITASDGTRTLGATFFVESEMPAIPQLILPAMDTKSERPVNFKWQDVTDPSGVTYTLQVAIDENFDDMVIEKQGLDESQYTMSQTEDEMLESTKKAANYWWRVKAVDGAGNESRWSSVRSFNIGFMPVMADWLKYLLIGLGGLVVLVIVFFVGRRIGHAH